MAFLSAAEGGFGGIGTGKIDWTLVVLQIFLHGEASGNYNLFRNKNKDIKITKICVFSIGISVGRAVTVHSFWLLFNKRVEMNSHFKLFLGDQRTKEGELVKFKAKNSKSFRMRTHNIT